jgi:hypothetical protein
MDGASYLLQAEGFLSGTAVCKVWCEEGQVHYRWIADWHQEAGHEVAGGGRDGMGKQV